jgi:hypothetical protein
MAIMQQSIHLQEEMLQKANKKLAHYRIFYKLHINIADDK